MIDKRMIHTMLGTFTLLLRDGFIIRLFFENDNIGAEKELQKMLDCESINNAREGDSEETKRVCLAAIQQLDEYAAGKRRCFELPLMIYGVNDLTRRTAQALQHIPYGESVCYTELANTIGCKSVRAVGTAVGRNPLPIFIPCHRVIASSGKIGGFRGGIEFKKKLLTIEDMCVKE